MSGPASGASPTPLSLPVAPPSLKSLSNLLKRVTELLKPDPMLAYWCAYRALRLGIPQLHTLDNEGKSYLNALMDLLEEMKERLKGDQRLEDESGAEYVRGKALGVFGNADRLDRQGVNGRNTALAYLAASNFFDVLSEFGELDAEISSKLKYAKWRAGEISKAIREGRQPAPPPAAETDQDTDAKLAQLDLLGVGLGAQAGAASQEEKEYLDREMRKLEGDAGVDVPSAPAFSVDPGQGPTAISPDEGMDALSLAGAATAPRGGAPLTPNKGGRAHSRLSVDARSMNIGPFISPNAGEGAARLAPPDFAAQGLGSSPNFSKPMRSQLSRSGSGEDVEDAASTPPHLSPNFGHSRRSASEYVGGASNEATSEDVFGRRSLSPSLSGQPPSRPSSAFLSFPSHQGPGPAGSGSVSPGSRPLPMPPGFNPSAASTANGNGSSSGNNNSALASVGAFAPAPPGSVAASRPPIPPPHRAATAFAPPSTHAPSAPLFSPAPPSITPSAPPSSDLQSQPTSSNIDSTSNAVAAPPSAPAPAPAPPPTIALPQSLDASASAKVQKYAKWAASSMDHEDLDAARKFLRQALDILEGKEVEEGKGKIKR